MIRLITAGSPSSGCGQGNDSRKTYVLHSKARWQRKLLHHPAPDASHITSSSQRTPPSWRHASPPRDLKRRLSLTPLGGSQCVKSRHSIKYDSSSNLLSHFHHRPTSSLFLPMGGTVIIASQASSKGGGVLHSGTSGSAIKVACTPISSLISDKCLGFSHHWSIRSATPLHKSTHSLTHAHTHHTHHTGISQTPHTLTPTLGPDERP